MLRHKIKPGIAGWAPVNGLRGETGTPDKLRARVRDDIASRPSARRWPSSGGIRTRIDRGE